MHRFVHRISLLLMVMSGIQFNEAIRAPSTIEINKCCRIGEWLDHNQQCVSGGTETWWPAIHLVLKQDYFKPQGKAPRFMRAREHRPACDSPEIFTTIILFSNGSLYVGERNTLIDLIDYCVDQDTALVCLPNLNANSLRAPKTKIRKCCGQNSIYSSNDETCVLNTELKPLQLDVANIDLVYGFPKCATANNQFVIADEFHNDQLNIANGTYVQKTHKILASDEFCIDHRIHTNVSTVTVFVCADLVDKVDKEAIDKILTDTKIDENRRFRIYSIALIISVIFLSLTLAMGFLLPSNHHVLHCRCQSYYVGCLLVGDLLLAINQLARFNTGLLCSTIATSMHFFFLAAFFWLNTMCFNIYWTFRDFRPSTLGKKQEKIRLRVYKIYAWGFPLLITIIAAIMDNLPNSHNLLRPRFGEKKCWFIGDMEVFVYFFGPIGLLLFINIGLFVSTTRQLMCGLWKQDDVKSSNERAALGRVCMKLVVVMGITWIADVLSWAHNVWISDANANKNTTNSISYDIRYYFWYTMDTINALQGVLIFLVVASQPQVISTVVRFFTPKNSRSKLNATHGQHHSSSSNGLASIGESMNTFNHTNNSKVPMETIC